MRMWGVGGGGGGGGGERERERLKGQLELKGWTTESEKGRRK